MKSTKVRISAALMSPGINRIGWNVSIRGYSSVGRVTFRREIWLNCGVGASNNLILTFVGIENVCST